MSLSLDEIRSVCTASEYALVLASRSPAIEKLSVAELKKHASNARKLSDKWQKLSRGQSRTSSRATGSANLDSRSYEKQQVFHGALEAFQARLAVASATPTVEKATAKPTATKRTAAARAVRQSTRKELHFEKKAINKKAASKTVTKSAAAPAAPAATPKAAKKAKPAATKKPAAKAAAAKEKLVKTAAKRATKRAVAPAATAPAAPAKTKVVKETAKKGVVRPTAATAATLAGKAKANRVALSNKTSNIAGHVSGKGKRVQAKRDSKGR